MLPIRYFIPLLLVSLVNSKHHPFNSSECTECIEKFNYLHNHNRSLVKAVNSFNSFCDSYNISICRNITDYGISFLEQTPSDICRELGYCDVLNIESFVFDIHTATSSIYNIKLYTYYDLLIAFEETPIVSPPVLNFTQKWNLKLEEPINDELFSVIPVDASIIDSSTNTYMGSCGACSSTNNGYEYILKMCTENYMYYVNITDGLILYKYRIENINKLKSPINYPSKSERNVPAQYIYDTTYNGSLLMSSIVINASLSMCNTGTGQMDCQQNTILSIETQNVKIEMPEEKPRCGTALEMFCPHDGIGREDCLNCIIKNRENLIMCDVSTEENWCDRNNIAIK